MKGRPTETKKLMQAATDARPEKKCIVCCAVMRPAGWTVTEPQAGCVPMTVLRCSICGLVTTPWEFNSHDEVSSLYAQYSYCSESAWEVPGPTYYSLGEWVRRMEPYRRTNRWLDVGCGAGALLRVAAEHGWHVEGTELSTVAADRLRAEGFVVHVGFLPHLDLPAASFDVVTMVELIEHLTAPMEDLRAVHRLLRPGGALFLTTPNAGSLRCRLFGFREILRPPEHLYGFTPTALRKLLSQVGLRPVHVWTDGFNPYLFLQRLRPSKDSDAPDVWARTQRLRHWAMANLVGRAVKASVNAWMRLTWWGDTLKAIAVKPEA